MTVGAGLILRRANVDVPQVALVTDPLRRPVRRASHRIVADIPMAIDADHTLLAVDPVTD